MKEKVTNAQLEVLDALETLLTDYPEVNPVRYIQGIRNRLKT